MAWLAVTTGPRKGQTYQLRIGDNSLGRGAENDMVIEDNVVSRSHAMVRVRDDQMVDADCTEFVDYDGGIGEFRMAQRIGQQGGLAAAEKSHKQNDRSACDHGSSIGKGSSLHMSHSRM